MGELRLKFVKIIHNTLVPPRPSDLASTGMTPVISYRQKRRKSIEKVRKE